ncbi:Uncharacterised protein [Clostridium paraputrificum]|uniref:Uncharacterized protein n=1 Tax=Clostridium paraputrificum TaxID=29363 RepID=A0A6N3ELS7_9CLOT|nr:hypothetical protein [Clostridium sp.]
MKYAKSHALLPDEIIKIIQEYIDVATINELTKEYYKNLISI